MIRCEVVQENGKYRKFRCSGHAGYDDSGKDIVCASVSILVVNTVNAIEAFCDQEMVIDSNDRTGAIAVRFKDPVNEKTKLLMDAFVLGMTGISSEYDSSYVTFSIKEVAAC